MRPVDLGPANRKRRGLKVVLGMLGVVVVALVAYGVWFAVTLNSTLEKAGDDTISGDALEPTSFGEPFYVLAIGSDSREGSGTSSIEAESGDNERSDVMILVRIDPVDHLITMLSIPRDTPYRAEDGVLMKINETFNRGGAAKLVEAVNELTGIRVSHYATVHFSGLENIVDALGGVTVDVPVQLAYRDALTGEYVVIEPGVQTITGQQAQIFARARHEYGVDQDANRQNAVRMLTMAIIKKVLDRPANEIPGAVLAVAQYVGTDLRAGDVAALGLSFGTSLDDMTIYTGTGPYDGDINGENDLWMCYYNPEGWKRVMEVVDAGGNPEGMYFGDTAIPW